MGLLDKLFGKRRNPAPVPQHAVIVHFQYGSTDLSRLFALEEQLEEASAAAGVGEFDGNEVATDGSDGVRYMYGPEREAFLSEARRVLASSGWLVIYDNAFSGRMEGNRAFAAWVVAEYLRRYPSPPRARAGIDEADANGAGFAFVGGESYENVVSMSVESLVRYLVTQSNVIARVEGAGEPIDGVAEWLRAAIAPMFGDVEERFVFRGPVHYLRKV